MSIDTKEIIIEQARPRRRRKVPEVLNVPALPLDAPDFDAFVERLPQPSKTNATDRTPEGSLPLPGDGA